MNLADVALREFDRSFDHWWNDASHPADDPPPVRLQALGALLGQYAGIGGDSDAVEHAVESVVVSCWRDAEKRGKRYGTFIGAVIFVAGALPLVAAVAVVWGS